jgi:hypothetical protein
LSYNKTKSLSTSTVILVPSVAPLISIATASDVICTPLPTFTAKSTDCPSPALDVLAKPLPAATSST